MEGFLIELAKKFILRQALKYGAALDWALVKKDLVARVADLLPGTSFDREAQIIVGVLVDLCKEFFVRTGQQVDVTSLARAVNEATQGGIVRALAKQVATA